MHVEKLMEQFENCTLPKDQWSHENHFIMALWYCIKLPIPQAIDKIRNGIKNYNESVGGRNTDVSGYHETVTLFYIDQIVSYVIVNGIWQLTDEVLTVFLQQPMITKEFILRYYSEEVLMSKEARRHWVAPNIAAAV